jgi:hypothetical protein
MKKSLVNSLLTAGLVVGLTGCAKSPYEFDGLIGKEKVKFEKLFFPLRYHLTVKATNDVKTVYLDDSGDLKVDNLKVYNQKENPKNYESYPNHISRNFDNPLMPEVQKKFDWYLEQILATNKALAIRELRSAGIDLE